MTERPEDEIVSTSAGEQANPMEENRRKRKRRILKMLLGLLTLILVINLGIAAYYILTKQPLTKLPGVSAMTFTTPPRFLFSIYGVSKPNGVAVSPDGQRLYVAEVSGERQVRIFNRNGKEIGFLKPADPENPGAQAPFYVTTDAQGKVFFSDRSNGALRIYSPTGDYQGDLPAPPGEKAISALGASFDAAGQLYVTDIANDQHRVLVYDRDLHFKLQFGKTGEAPGEFSFPNGVAVDQQGRIFVADGNNRRIEVFGPDGAPLDGAGKPLIIGLQGLPRGLAIDDQNRLHVVDVTNHAVYVYNLGSPKLDPLFSFGEQGVGDGQFRYPVGIAIDPTGRVYVADRENDRVQVWAY